MIGRDEFALNAVDCDLRTSICVSHRSSLTRYGSSPADAAAVEFPSSVIDD